MLTGTACRGPDVSDGLYVLTWVPAELDVLDDPCPGKCLSLLGKLKLGTQFLVYPYLKPFAHMKNSR